MSSSLINVSSMGVEIRNIIERSISTNQRLVSGSHDHSWPLSSLKKWSKKIADSLRLRFENHSELDNYSWYLSPHVTLDSAPACPGPTKTPHKVLPVITLPSSPDWGSILPSYHYHCHCHCHCHYQHYQLRHWYLLSWLLNDPFSQPLSLQIPLKKGNK